MGECVNEYLFEHVLGAESGLGDVQHLPPAGGDPSKRRGRWPQPFHHSAVATNVVALATGKGRH